MTAIEHNKILAIGFAVFAAILALTFLLLLLVSLGVFVALGLTLGKETGGATPEAGIGILGAAVALIFYGLLGGIFVLPMAFASWKMWKSRRNARTWGIVAAILVAPIMPLGTMFGVYSLWFFFSAEGRQFYLNVASET